MFKRWLERHSTAQHVLQQLQMSGRPIEIEAALHRIVCGIFSDGIIICGDGIIINAKNVNTYQLSKVKVVD